MLRLKKHVNEVYTNEMRKVVSQFSSTNTITFPYWDIVITGLLLIPLKQKTPKPEHVFHYIGEIKWLIYILLFRLKF